MGRKRVPLFRLQGFFSRPFSAQGYDEVRGSTPPPARFLFPALSFRPGFRPRRVLFRPFSGCEGFLFRPSGVSFPPVLCWYFTFARFHSVQVFARAGFFLDRLPAAKGFFSARLGLLFRPFRACKRFFLRPRRVPFPPERVFFPTCPWRVRPGSRPRRGLLRQERGASWILYARVFFPRPGI